MDATRTPIGHCEPHTLLDHYNDSRSTPWVVVKVEQASPQLSNSGAVGGAGMSVERG